MPEGYHHLTRDLRCQLYTLKKRGVTLNIYTDEKLILKVGSDAKPGLLAILGPIEVKDLKSVLVLLKE